MPYSSAALEDESLPPPEASPAGQSGSRSVTALDSDAPAGSEKNDPGPAPFHQHPRPEGFHIFPQEKGLPPTPPIEQPPIQKPPPESNEPYIPSAKRPYDQWGTPDFSRGGPYMPQPRDIPRLIHNVVMGLGRWGSHYTGMPAIAMGTYANAYWQAYQKGMKERAADNWQKYREARQMTLDRQKEETQAAKEGIALYKNDPEKLKQYLQQLATKYQDQNLANAIATNPAAVDELLATRDTHWHDLAKAKQIEDEREQIMQIRAAQERRRQEKEQRDAEARKRLEDERRRIDPNAGPLPPGAGPDAGAGAEEPIIPPVGGGGEAGGDAAPDAEPDAGASPDAGAGGAESDTPVQTADASSAVPIGRGVETPAAPPKGIEPEGKPEVPFLENAAKDWAVRGTKMPASLGKKGMEDFQQRAETRGEQWKNWLDSLESNPDLSPNQIKAAVRKNFPQLGSTMEGYLNGTLTPQNPRTNPMWARVISLGERVDPSFSQGTFASRQKAIQYWTNGEGGKTLTSNGQVLNHLADLLEDLPNKPYPFTGLIDKWTGIEGYKTSEFENLINTVNQEYARALSGKGGTIPELKEQGNELSINMTEGAMRANIKSKLKALKVRINQLKDAFATTTGWPGRDILDRFDRYAATADEETKKAAATLRRFDAGGDIGGGGGGSSAHTPDEIAGAKKWLADPKNANDPRRSKIQEMIGGQ